MSPHNTAPPPPLPHTADLARRAFLLAARAVVTDIETEGHRISIDGERDWWDVAAMVDEREQPPEFVDMARQAIDYALAVGIAVAHPDHPRRLWLRIVWRDA